MNDGFLGCWKDVLSCATLLLRSFKTVQSTKQKQHSWKSGQVPMGKGRASAAVWLFSVTRIWDPLGLQTQLSSLFTQAHGNHFS